jgi:uncharacterized membrane protein
MRVCEDIEINAPPEAVWKMVADPTTYLHFMSGITRWEVVSAQPGGMGARYRMLLRVGSAEIGGLIEIVEWKEPLDVAWTSVTGVDQRGRWRLRARDGGTWVQLRLSYGVAGSGIWGLIADRVAAPSVRGHLRRTLQQLKRQVEYQQLRDAAAARRGARTGAA